MLLDVNSGIINVIDAVTYDVLDTYKGDNRDDVYAVLAGQYGRRELTEAMDELDGLIERELLLRLCASPSKSSLTNVPS